MLTRTLPIALIRPPIRLLPPPTMIRWGIDAGPKGRAMTVGRTAGAISDGVANDD